MLEIAHLDLKLENIIILEDGGLALIDFGLSKDSEYYLSYPCGTDGYFPPEVRLTIDFPERNY